MPKRGKQAAMASEREKAPTHLGVAVRHEFFQGPFPPPQVLAQYEEIQPGLVDRIFKYAEEEQSHRHELQRNRASTENFDVRSGFWAHAITNLCVTTMFIALLVAGSFALYLGNVKTALAILALPIGRLVIAMIQMRRGGAAEKKTGNKR